MKIYKILLISLCLNLVSSFGIANAERLIQPDTLEQWPILDLSEIIIGTWSVENVEPTASGATSPCKRNGQSVEANYNAPGTVVFSSDGTYSISEGRLAVAGLEKDDEAYLPVNYEVKDQKTLLLYYTHISLNKITPWVCLVRFLRKDTIVLVSSGGGCGIYGGLRISKLTRISE